MESSRYYLDVRFAHAVIYDEAGHILKDLAEAMIIAQRLLVGLKGADAGVFPYVEISDEKGLLATVPARSSHVAQPGSSHDGSHLGDSLRSRIVPYPE